MTSPNDASQSSTEGIRSRFVKLFPSLPAAAIDQLVVYKTELLRYATASNFVPSSLISQVDTAHFADSFCAGEIIFSQVLPTAPLYDLATAFGFPGLIFAIMRPDREIILVERDSRKADFIKTVISNTGIKNARIISSGSDDLSEDVVKLAVARGFGHLSKAMLSTRKITDVGGVIYYMKGDNWPQELAGVPSQLFTHWDVALAGTYRIPETETDMAVISAKKISD